MNADKLGDILNELDGVMITSPHNLRYFTGFCGGEGVAVITSSKKYLFIDSRYTVAAKEEAHGFDVVEYAPGKRMTEVLERIGDVRTLGFEDAYMSVLEYNEYKKSFNNIKTVGISKKTEELRMIKTSLELELIRHAEQLGIDAFLKVLPMIRPGIAERDIAAELEYQMRRIGADGTSFETIAVSGARTGMPHGIPSDKKIEYGDFVTMDFGCRYKGYCSDMTRTVVVGKADEEQKRIYSIVLKAQLCGLETIKSGVAGKEADAAARRIIEDAGFGKFFGHSLGHGVGLLIHEQPNLSPNGEKILKPGMVVTCEPGIYIPDFGGVRIEDAVIVTDEGNDNMTRLSKELVEI